jgi:WW domain-containing oxidoreductase
LIYYLFNRCSYLALDLASLSSVRQFVRRLAVLQPTSSSNLSLLVLNAGLFGLPLTTTEDGLEQMMQVVLRIRIFVNPDLDSTNFSYRSLLKKRGTGTRRNLPFLCSLLLVF